MDLSKSDQSIIFMGQFVTTVLAALIKALEENGSLKSGQVDETSYEDCCVKSVLFSADRHRPVPSRVGILGCRGGAPCGEGVPSPTSYPAGQRPRHDPMFGSEELRGERRHSTSAALSDSPR